VGIDDDVHPSVCLSVCPSVTNRASVRLVQKLQTNQRENLEQCWDHESRLPDAILWRHHKSKMADGR